ncbi:MAG: hypothetical protein AB7V14_12815, partial [Kiritimatiellia bacterium]
MSIRVHPWLFSDLGLEEASGGSKRLENAKNGLKIAKNGPQNTKFGRKTGKFHENRRLGGSILGSCPFPVFLLKIPGSGAVLSCKPQKRSPTLKRGLRTKKARGSAWRPGGTAARKNAQKRPENGPKSSKTGQNSLKTALRRISWKHVELAAVEEDAGPVVREGA